ncbi:hypothetical protein GCK72_022955 [Caenorhabditis remanei]|uniref:Major sperm protein n=1 Tax=Caenorhabditis remanei TaxID=31234 RepID=A0A6A5FVN2_CAERE|nr:hypothetical protein GCK72_022955 [Caenorhabditis remanei]KAF1746499.1 hypothetical protein GCK72_022955 [Caenorhabditis remanei]
MDSSNNSSNQPARAEPSANGARQRGRPRRTVVPKTVFDATPAQCKSSAPVIASNTQNKGGAKRKEQVVDKRDSTEEDNTQKRNKLEPIPSAPFAISQSSAALPSGASLLVTPPPFHQASTSSQSISNSSLARNTTSKAGTTHKPAIDVRARSRPFEVLAALRGSPLPDLQVTSTTSDLLAPKVCTAENPARPAPRPAAPSTATPSNFQFASGVGTRGTAAQASSTTVAVAHRFRLQKQENHPGLQQKHRFATKHLTEYVAKNASQGVAVMSMEKEAEEQGNHRNDSLRQHETDNMEFPPYNTEEGEMRRVDEVQLNHNVKCDVDDEDVMVIEEKLATGNVSTHNVEPVTAQVKQQYLRRSYPVTQSSHQFMPQLRYHRETQHENKQAQSSRVTNFIQKTSEAPTFEKKYMTQEDLMDVKLGKIETQPLQAIKFNCPFDLPKENYFKVKNISEHRIGIMINVSSGDRIDLDTQLACLRPLKSITIKVTTRSFDLKEFTKDFIAIEWMNVLDNTVLTNEWFDGDGPRNKKTLIVEYSL